MSVAVWIVLAILSAVLGAEFVAWSRPAQRWLLRLAASPLPREHADRYYEEWLGQLDEIPDGPVTRLLWCLSLVLRRREMVAALHGMPRRTSLLARGVKRATDALAAALLLVVFAVPLVVIAAAIRVSSEGPAFYRYTCIGIGGRPFTALKFRTMVVNAADVHDEPRVTRIGRLLRRSSLDELPQLVNVFRGHMSLVGPRPALPDEVAEYSAVEHRRLLVKPGMTGLWQVSGRWEESYWDEIVRLDLEYVDTWTPLSDLRIMWRTVVVVVQGNGER